MSTLPNLDHIIERHDELAKLMSDPSVHADPMAYRVLAREHGDIAPIVEKELECRKLREQISEDEEILNGDDEELKELASEELEEYRASLDSLEVEIKELLLPKDPDDDRDIVMEIRAGTGGDEAAIFAADLYRMYMKFIERKGWKTEPLSSSAINLGGFKEVAFAVSGKGVYGILKFESGVHRVQRVPETESSGRVHTSAASVVVLPEAGEVEVEINANELKIDVYRSSGPGGQSVNTTDSAVRITHIPTGLVVTCQDEKSQHKNKAKALKVLRARLFDMKKQEQESSIAEERRIHVGSGDRSVKVRTYNFPQNRVTDHRINLTLYSLDAVIDGDLDKLIEENKIHTRAQLLEKMNDSN